MYIARIFKVWGAKVNFAIFLYPGRKYFKFGNEMCNALKEASHKVYIFLIRVSEAAESDHYII